MPNFWDNDPILSAAPSPPAALDGPGAMPPGTIPGRMQAQPQAPDASMVPLSANAQQATALMRVNGLMGDRAGVQSENDILQADPTYQARRNQATKMGENAAILAAKQAAGSQILSGVSRLHDLIESADDATIKNAMGPYNTTEVPPSAVAPLSYGAWRDPNLMTRTQARAAYVPDADSQKYWDFQNRLDHLVNGLTEQFVSSTGGQGGQMSDARQKVFAETMGALRRSTSKDEALKIANDAQDIIRGTFNLQQPQAAKTATANSSSPNVPKIEASKNLNGVNYFKINGKWYQE